jgi:hypothetical protein
MSKVCSNTDAEATAGERTAAAEDRRARSRPAARAGEPVRSHRQKPALAGKHHGGAPASA